MPTLSVLGGTEVDSVESAWNLRIGCLIKSLDIRSKSNLADLVVIQSSACDDGMWAQIVGESMFIWKDVSTCRLI